MMESVDTREALWLVRNGVPFDVAFGVDAITRTAWCLMFSEMETGREFNWNTLKFEEPKREGV